jgi:hypothetical protein
MFFSLFVADGQALNVFKPMADDPEPFVLVVVFAVANEVWR